ncbi:hypothetical protein A3E15_01690 [Candidatus Woesebacteria bacterium RIFCSPHIGHO2_12_FULL_42_9]|uniref:Glycosidase n=3 Tax=Candidatus Woeseibacteriota TaxID=1752722 RepID=A0A1F8AX92_9BACT|nr:MAG: hypothetical protein A2129_02545 [Candidatus Woesebacteria bacterium GWC1_42_13]OGM56372.1 MAG: hypothetical protein A3E15_01690 [Candidatus Woesebacteria bacterium RIFCSPHIGHO2_12_FULL_42_9]
MIKFNRFDGNPIISPREGIVWEEKGTFNPAAVYEGGSVHIIYRAASSDNTSRMGFARSQDGFYIVERSHQPVYFPREVFEQKSVAGGGNGCEDPRISRLEGRFYMCYTAHDGKEARATITSISHEDFIDKNWVWEKPLLMTEPGVFDKDAAIFPEKINGKYAIFHRPGDSIWLDFVDELSFGEGKWLKGVEVLKPRPDKWDNARVGISSPPIKTSEGWLVLYHGIKDPEHAYKASAMLLDLADPTRLRAIYNEPLFEAIAKYEKEGPVPNVIFPCGAVAVGDELFVYYGGADRVVGVCTCNIEELVSDILKEGSL